MRIIERVNYLMLGDQRQAAGAAVTQCAAEHGGHLVGRPSIEFRDNFTHLRVDRSSWWEEWAAVHTPSLTVRELLKRGLDPSLAQAILADLRAAWRGSVG